MPDDTNALSRTAYGLGRNERDGIHIAIFGELLRRREDPRKVVIEMLNKIFLRAKVRRKAKRAKGHVPETLLLNRAKKSLHARLPKDVDLLLRLNKKKKRLAVAVP